jgi:hypothetical protein
MNPFLTLIQFLSGKKTYLTAIVAGVLLFGDWQHWWQMPDQVYDGLMALALVFLRAGIAKGPDDPASASTSSTSSAPPAPGNGTAPITRLPLMLAFACLTLFAGFTLITTSGCNTTPQTVAYQAAGTTVVTVDTAMNLWGAYVAANHPSANVELEVKSAYEKYQASMAVALDAGAAYAATSVTNATAAQQASLAAQQAISTAGQDLSDLENLITSFGVKLQ